MGFYSDDWYYSAFFEACGDQSTLGLFKCLFASEQYRPGHVFELAVLYRTFGLHPLPYHIWEMFLHGLCAVLLYLVLRKTQLPRMQALAIALLWAALPHYSTDRFWIASLQANLSLALFLLGVLAALCIPDIHVSKRTGCTAFSLLAFTASALTYEVCFPLIALLPFLLWFRVRSTSNEPASLAKFLKNAAPYLYGLGGVALGVVVYKFATQDRLPVASHLGILNSAGPLVMHAVRQAIDFNFGKFGAGLPAIAWRTIACRLDDKSIFLACIFGLCIFGYISFLSDIANTIPSRKFSLWTIVAGLVIFGLGYSIFVPFRNLELANLGIANRINIASAVGVAISWIGIFGLASSLLPSPRASAHCFALLVAFFSTCGLIVVEGTASYWVESTREQKIILDDLRTHFPEPPQNAVLLIDGVCPYIGPAPLFKTNWDSSGAVQLLYKGRLDLRGDLISPAMEIGDDGITIEFEKFKSTYRYSEPLFVYNYSSKQLIRLSNRFEASRYFESLESSFTNGCGAREGYGTPACFFRK